MKRFAWIEVLAAALILWGVSKLPFFAGVISVLTARN